MVAVAWMGAMRLSVIAALTGANGTVQLFTPRFWTVSTVRGRLGGRCGRVWW